MTYKEKLLDPRWQKKRLEILQRDNFKCRYCEDDQTTLHIHHLTYKTKYTDPWDYDESYLMTACKDCHHVITELEGEYEYVSGFKDFSTDKKTTFLTCLLYNIQKEVHLIQLLKVDNQNNYFMQGEVPDFLFGKFIKLITLSKKLKWLTDFSTQTTTKADL